MTSELERLCSRYEIAVGNFGRSCAGMRANEKSFQAWYASCVIQELGLSRVYREVHLSKGSLFADIEAHELWEPLEKGNELFPDLVVSWEPDIDARHSSSRTEALRGAGAMLSRLAIVSELKVTGSTGKSTLRHAVRQDLAKLAVFAAACPANGDVRGIATYMVVLDNHCDDCDEPTGMHEEEATRKLLNEAAEDWPAGVRVPVVLLIPADGRMVRIETSAGPQRVKPAASHSTIWELISERWKAIGSEWAIAGASKKRELRLVNVALAPAEGVYLWEYGKDGTFWADLFIGGPDKLMNSAMLDRIKENEKLIREGIDAEFEVESYGKRNQVTAGFRVKSADREPSAELAVTLMKALIERTWPLVDGNVATS